jgi:hypothetical protein
MQRIASESEVILKNGVDHVTDEDFIHPIKWLYGVNVCPVEERGIAGRDR